MRFTVANRDDALAEPFEQIAVVRDDEQRAVVLGQHVFERFAARDVEIVGRLVEEEAVGALRHQPREHDAPPLAAGERLDHLVTGVTAEVQAAQ